jgi:alanine racemase
MPPTCAQLDIGQQIRPTWCEIDLDAITHNFRVLRQLLRPGVKIIPSLKRNAHGCGAAQVACLLQSIGADGVAFGNIDDALAARRAGCTLPTLLYPNCLPTAADIVCHCAFMPTISTVDDVAAWSSAAPGPIEVFLKLDAGGLRAGALPSEAVGVARAIVGSKRLKLAGVYGHPMASYGMEDATFTVAQIAAFGRLLETIAQAGIDIPIRMVASSAIVLAHPDADFNAVDPGRLIAGCGFSAVPERRREWRPALAALKSRLVMKKSLADLGGLDAIAPFFPVSGDTIIGLIPFGWSDGYPRHLPQGACALVRGKRAPLLGPVHSELLRIDLTPIPDAQLGDEVVLLGHSDGLNLTMEEVCRQWNVASSELLLAIRGHVARKYISHSDGVLQGL